MSSTTSLLAGPPRAAAWSTELIRGSLPCGDVAGAGRHYLSGAGRANGRRVSAPATASRCCTRRRPQGVRPCAISSPRQEEGLPPGRVKADPLHSTDPPRPASMSSRAFAVAAARECSPRRARPAPERVLTLQASLLPQPCSPSSLSRSSSPLPSRPRAASRSRSCRPPSRRVPRASALCVACGRRRCAADAIPVPLRLPRRVRSSSSERSGTASTVSSLVSAAG